MASVTNRTAVYGSVRTVVWQGSVGDRRPYADQIPITLSDPDFGERRKLVRTLFSSTTEWKVRQWS